MVFGAGKGEGGYNKAKNGAKNAEDTPSELCLSVLTLVKQRYNCKSRQSPFYCDAEKERYRVTEGRFIK